MSEQLSKVYEPEQLETEISRFWLKSKYFHAEPPSHDEDARTDVYTIVIPPPNVTAPLHLGHALNNTLQDIMIRFHRMQQYNTLWMPGTDHAGIATQTVVEKRILSEENRRRTDFSRDEFVSRVQAWKDEYEKQIINQLQAMGCSCDWQRRRFTMDEVCAKAVRSTFFRLFRDGLIYRGKRLVNWDPATQTVLADDEVEYETIEGHFWYMRYPLIEPVKIDGKLLEHITVATTRPETMLGDTAVAMSPKDKRAKSLAGKKIRLPIVGRIIPIITDEHVVLPDAESEDEKAAFSTGFLKVTPAHDPDDWQIGLKHNLEVINVMAPDGTISDKYGWPDAGDTDAEFLLGMDRFEARKAVVEWFRSENLLEDVKPYTHQVGHSYRSHVPIEPYLSDQWYIAVKKPIKHLAEKFGEGLIENTDIPVNSLAGLALKPLLDNRFRFIPQRYAKTYQSWLENLRDWPISRQLWWGHQIPVWKLPSSNLDFIDKIKKSELANLDSDSQPTQADIEIKGKLAHLQTRFEKGQTWTYFCIPQDAAEVEQYLENRGAERDTDVLDTWFSSALWPFSTLGWPDTTAEMETYYPGDVLCTAREIITLWVSRMVMMGQYCAGDIPFRDVYIHAMIQDGQGRKMSKSLGNGIDPLAAIDSHGADAMRFTLASMTTETQDVRMPVEKMKLPDGRYANTSPKFDLGRNFCNKLWNASRFAMMNLDGIEPDKFDAGKLDITDKWILKRLSCAITETTQQLNDYKFHESLHSMSRFFWNEFCDWYLEWVKPRMENKQQKQTAQNVLAFVLDRILRLLHPFVPFITEGIFQKLNEIAPVRKLKGLAESTASDALVVAQWPKELDFTKADDYDVEADIDYIQRAARHIRHIRNQHNVPSSRKLNVLINVSGKDTQPVVDLFNKLGSMVCQLEHLDKFSAGADIKKPETAAGGIEDDIQVYVYPVIDPEVERDRLKKQKDKIEKARKATEAKLCNENFITKARPEVVNHTREKMAKLSEQLGTINKHLAELET